MRLHVVEGRLCVICCFLVYFGFILQKDFVVSVKSCNFASLFYCTYRAMSQNNNIIYELCQMRIFSPMDVSHTMQMTTKAVSGALLRWQEQGFIRQIRRGLYTAIDPVSGMPIADRYEIGSRVSAIAYIGWHSALEIHGLAHQQYFSLYVASESAFNPFTFEDIDFLCCDMPSLHELGVVTPVGTHYRVTDLERTLIDCFDRINRAGGVEELLHCMEGIRILDEQKLRTYLAAYNKKFLYQKAGFFLEYIQEQAHISDQLISDFRQQGATCVQHLTSDGDCTQYIKQWKLYVPTYCLPDKSILGMF